MKFGIWRKLFTILLFFAVFVTSSYFGDLSAEAASTVKVVKSETYHLYHNKWTASGGARTVNDNVKAKLHYIDHVYGYCVYMQDSSREGAVKEITPASDNRTDWLTKKKNGYQRAAYCAVADAYLVQKSISLEGISDSRNLMNLTKTERMFLSQSFVWYMQFSGWKRTEGSWAMAIKGIKGWSAAKQYRLFDQLLEAIKNELSSVTTTMKCYENKVEGNRHQPIAIFSCKVNKPEYGTVSRNAQKTDSQRVNFQVKKTDLETETGLSGAVFSFSCDGEKTGTAETGEDGSASYIYDRTVKTQNYTVTKKYVRNWKDLSSDLQKEETQKGNYSDAILAGSVAQSEANQKAEAELTSLLSQIHTWEVTEIRPPFGHSIAPSSMQSVKETLSEKSFVLHYVNPAQYRNIQLKKRSSHEEKGSEASLEGAVYGLYAKDDVFDTSNKNVVYEPDELVEELRTDEAGNASISGLHPGRYYLKELIAPKGFEVDEKSYVTDVSDSDVSVTVTDQLIRGRIKITKTYGQGILEQGAVFEIFDSKEEQVASITTDNTGTALTNYLPYGTYTVRQTTGIDGYALMPDQMIFIEKSKIYQIQENDEELHAGITILKTTLVNDRETGYYEKRSEEGATFKITKDGNLVETIVTNRNGLAKSGKLEPGCTYHVEQTEGAVNFEKIKPFDVQFLPEEYLVKRFLFEDHYNGKKIKVKKTMTENGKTLSEVGAEFVILDAQAVHDLEGIDLSSLEKRQEYCKSLSDEEIITTICTDEHGESTALLTNLPENHEFVVLQVNGEEGYQLADPYFSEVHHPQEEGSVKLYSFQADDLLDDWAKIGISKSMVTEKNSKGVVTKPEPDAEFQILDSQGKVVETLCTDKSGEAVSKQLKFGIYMIHQVKGADTHEKCTDRRIILTSENKHKTVMCEITNEEKTVTFELTKQSGQTGRLLNGATYEIYNDGNNRIATFTTGLLEEGKAVCELPYGEYTVKEIKAPDGYKLSEPFLIEISMGNTVVRNGHAVYERIDFDEPVYAKIVLKKKGDVLEGVSEGQFVYKEAAIEGAEYTLYARKDIVKDDGTILYPAGMEIDRCTTDKKGVVEFKRTDDDKKTTSLFPMGEYYIKETKSIYGYTLDQKEHDVVLSWDRKAESLNKDTNTETEEIEEKEEPVKPEPNAGKYILKSVAPDTEYDWQKTSDAIIFTNEAAPDGVPTTDVSSLEDGSVVMWQMGTSVYISTQTEGQDVIFNVNSEGLFKNAKARNIYFDCVDTSQTEVMTSMFENCDNLTVLNLSNFNTEKVSFLDRMFYSCDQLVTIYTADAKLQDIVPETLTIQSMTAEPKYEFLIGSTYMLRDFNFYEEYSDGSRQKVELNESEVLIEPEKAKITGKELVTFRFLSGSSYEKFQSIQTETTVVDVQEVSEEPLRDFEKEIALSNQLKTHRIQFCKMDEEGNPVEGAEFTLYSACEIVNAKGETLYQSGDAIMTTYSELDGEMARVDFRGLPSDMYKKNEKEKGVMFYVKETKAAPGYKMTDTVMEFDMDLEAYGNAVSIIHTSSPDEDKEISEEFVTVCDVQDVRNESLPYITIQKTWNDYSDASGLRPKEIAVELTLSGGEVFSYTLKESDGWQQVTDIPKEQLSFVQDVTEKGAEEYHSVIERHTREGVIEIINTPKVLKKKLAVKKIWKDELNQDGLRPDKVIVDLYRNGKEYQSYELNEENGWYIEVKNLEVTDEENGLYEYEFREREFPELTENPNTGYKSTIQIVEPSMDNQLSCETTMITNQHIPETASFTVKKEWKDEEDFDELRPKEIEVYLCSGNSTFKTVKLRKENQWTETVLNVPVYENGQKIEYRWEEKQEKWLTGDKNSGYEVSYRNQKAMVENPCIIENEHEVKRGMITVRKVIQSDEIMWDKMTPKFVFELKGVTAKGETCQKSVVMEFTEAEVNELQKTQGVTVWKECRFENLLSGTYTITEGGTEGFYELTSIESKSDGVEIEDADGNVQKSLTVQIGSNTEDDNRTWEAKAIFTNITRKGNIQIHKTGKENQGLKGVEFTLYDCAGKKIKSETTDQDGNCSFENLPINDYVIEETKTVKGYFLLKDKINVSVPLAFTKEELEERNADKKQAIKQGNYYYYYDISYDIGNSVTLALPSTGRRRQYKYLILGVLFICVASCLQKKGRKGKYSDKKI